MNRNHRLFYFLITGLTIGVLCQASCLIGTTLGAVSHQKQHAATVSLDTYPVMKGADAIKRRPNSVIVYQTDQTPLGDRQPLLLVHGLRAEYRDQCRWSKVIAHLSKDARFNKKYKIYLVRYDSKADLSKTLPLFSSAFMQLYENTGRKPMTVLAMSLGGVLTFAAMQDPKIDSAISLFFAMATPFHGSPLFCSDWFQYSLYKNLSYPITRVDHSLTYRIYFDHNENLLSDINWDNCDGRMPSNVNKFHSKLLFGPSGTLTLQRDCNFNLAQLNQNSHVDKSKMITYAAYLNNPYLLPGLREEVERTILSPYTFLTMKVPAHLAREHPVLDMLNRELSRIIPAKGQDIPAIKYPYGLNDGISPICSSLFLAPEVCRDIPIAKEEDIPRIKSKTDVRVARVFKNTDHLSFLDGYHPHPSPDNVVDELNPQQTARPILDWILADLLDASNQTTANIADH